MAVTFEYYSGTYGGGLPEAAFASCVNVAETHVKWLCAAGDCVALGSDFFGLEPGDRLVGIVGASDYEVRFTDGVKCGKPARVGTRGGAAAYKAARRDGRPGGALTRPRKK